MRPDIVQEVQGLYGPFSLSERIIQQIWMQGDFYQDELRTESGKALKILDPGRWNTNEGPDFKEARLELEGIEQIGDVEIHFRADDWFHHDHECNPNFTRVLLHVVLYPGGSSGAAVAELPMETLVLMPLLERDLESYAMDAALVDLEQVGELPWFDTFVARPVSERRAILAELAAARWRQKVAYRKKRLLAIGWSRACHESALEVLGYARNRGVMHKIAQSLAAADFGTGLDTGELFERYRGEWKLSGCRPANHPKVRLEQYARICRANPDWPDQLREVLTRAIHSQEREVAAFRKSTQSKELERVIAEKVFQGVIGDKRLSTLLCDAIFPLAESEFGAGWAPYWQAWYAGDFPGGFARFHRQGGLVDRREPVSNGIMQGILGLFLNKGQFEPIDSRHEKSPCKEGLFERCLWFGVKKNRPGLV